MMNSLLTVAAIWLVSLLLIRRNEYSNCSIDWDEGIVVENVSKWSTGVIFMITCIASGPFIYDIASIAGVNEYRRYEPMICILFIYYILERFTVYVTHRACIKRNQPRLEGLMKTKAADKNIIFGRKYNVKLEPYWRHTVIMGNGLMLPHNRYNIKDYYSEDVEIIPFPKK